VGKTVVIYIKFLCDVPCQKLFKSVSVLRSHVQNVTLAQFFLRHGVVRSELFYRLPAVSRILCFFCLAWYCVTSPLCPVCGDRRWEHAAHDAAATRAQCLALSKVCWYCVPVRLGPCVTPPLCPVCSGRSSEKDVINNCPKQQCVHEWVSHPQLSRPVSIVCSVSSKTRQCSSEHRGCPMHLYSLKWSLYNWNQWATQQLSRVA